MAELDLGSVIGPEGPAGAGFPAGGAAGTFLQKKSAADYDTRWADPFFAAASQTAAMPSFDAEAAGLPIKDVTVNILPAQAGSGDPSLTNERAISGWTGCVLAHSGSDVTSPSTLSVSWQGAAGTVYLGTLDLTSGVLTVTGGCIDMGGLNWLVVQAGYIAVNKDNVQSVTGFNPRRSSDMYLLCSVFKSDLLAATTNQIRVMVYDYTDPADFIADVTGKQLCFELETPVTYQLAAHELYTLLGENKLWADCGSVTVASGAYIVAVKEYADRGDQRVRASVAGIESGFSASRAYAAREFFYVGADLYEVLSPIASGATITPGTNARRVILSEALAPRKQKGFVTLSASWTGSGPYTQTVTVTGAAVTVNSKVDLQPDADVIGALSTAGVSALYVVNTSGVLTAVALGAAPSASITVQCTVEEVAA